MAKIEFHAGLHPRSTITSMYWLWMTIGALTCRAGYGVLTKVMSRDIEASSAAHALLLLSVSATISVLICPFVGGLSFQGVRDHPSSVVMMLIALPIGNALYFRGVQQLPAGIAQIAFSSSLIWGAAFSILVLHSSFSLVQLLGALLLIGAIWLAQYERGERPNAGIFNMVASGAFIALFLVFGASAAKSLTLGTYLVLAYSVPALITFLAFRRRLSQDLHTLKRKRVAAIKSTLPSAVASVGYYIFAFRAYQTAPDAGVVVMLFTAQVILAVMLAMIFLGERRHPLRTLLAAALAFIAGVAIKS